MDPPTYIRYSGLKHRQLEKFCEIGQGIVLRCLLFANEMVQYSCSVKRILLLVCILDTIVTDEETVKQLRDGKRIMALQALVVDMKTCLNEISVSLKRKI